MTTIKKPQIKRVRTPEYNYDFNPVTGFFARWGKTLKEDPIYSPLGPEILDLEISTICHGVGGPCKFCYKKNNPNGVHMNFDTFKTIFDKMPKNLTQIAFGIGDTNGNPDMFKMFDYAREHGVIPNVTINGAGLNKQLAERFAGVCGAVAVSRYGDGNVCYNAVKMLTDAGLKQVNIHMLVAQETLDNCYKLLDDMENDERLKKMQATVFLTLKKRGGGVGFNTVSLEDYKKLTNYALDKKLRIGFDSCSANKFLKVVEDRPEYPMLKTFAEPCESGLFSSYINVKGKFFPCSFTEDGEGLDVVNCEDFLQDIWFNGQNQKWRKRLLTNCRNCPVYKI